MWNYKSQVTSDIGNAIRQVRSGEVDVSKQFADPLLLDAVGAEACARGSLIESLSDREPELFWLIGSGQTTAEIASQLHLSAKTIETHRERIKYKLNLTTAAQLAREAAQNVLKNA